MKQTKYKEKTNLNTVKKTMEKEKPIDRSQMRKRLKQNKKDDGNLEHNGAFKLM